MKKALLALALGLLLLLPVSLAAQTAGVDHTIVTSWTQPVGAACSATVTVNCFNGYTETLTPPAGVAGVNTISLGLVTTYSWTPGGLLFCGTWQISLVANWIDLSGIAAVSAPAKGTVVEPCPFAANPATGLSIKLQ